MENAIIIQVRGYRARAHLSILVCIENIVAYSNHLPYVFSYGSSFYTDMENSDLIYMKFYLVPVPTTSIARHYY